MIILANVMIPSIAEHLIIMLVLLVPIAVVEAMVLARRHLLKYKESISLSFRANWRSTIVGLPIGYGFALLGVIPAGMFATLLPEDIGSLIGTILFSAIGHGGTIPSIYDEVGYYIGTLLVMIPYYLVTLKVEKKHIAKLKRDLDNDQLATTVRLMNGITYAILAMPIIVGAFNAATKFSK